MRRHVCFLPEGLLLSPSVHPKDGLSSSKKLPRKGSGNSVLWIFSGVLWLPLVEWHASPLEPSSATGTLATVPTGFASVTTV